MEPCSAPTGCGLLTSPGGQKPCDLLADQRKHWVVARAWLHAVHSPSNGGNIMRGLSAEPGLGAYAQLVRLLLG
jgi:hypothetical protein